MDPDEDRYDDKEAKKRFEAALRGARIAGPRHTKSDAPKRPRTPRNRRKKK
jgi:hypothetical protein